VIFLTCPDGTEAHPAYCTMGTGSYPGIKRLGRGVDHPLHLAPRLKNRAIHLLLLWAFVACSGVNFTRPSCISECILGVTGQIVDGGRNACTQIVERIETRQFCARLHIWASCAGVEMVNMSATDLFTLCVRFPICYVTLSAHN
jgi:hypothetical protein